MKKRDRIQVFYLYLLIAAILTILPPYVTYNFRLGDVLNINTFILTNSIKNDFSFLFPFFNLATLILSLGAIFFGKLYSRTFSILASINYLISGVLQNISISDRYGFAITLSTLFLTLYVAGAWFFEVFSNQNDFTESPRSKRLVILVPIILLAIWQPINPSTLKPDFNPVYFLSSGSALTFCMMTIISISVLIAYYPKINQTTLLITSIVGLFIGIGNLWLEFIQIPDLFWVGVLHIPLVCLSLIGISFSLRKTLQVAT